MEGSEEQEPLVEKKGKTTSVVWKHYGFAVSDVEQTKIVCKTCGAVVPSPKGNTTNLFIHLKSSHKPIYVQAVKEQREKAPSTSVSDTATQLSIQATLYNAAPYPTSSRRHKEITNSITFFLAKDQCAINTVENPGFKKMVKTLDKRYALPSRHHFSREALPALYKECRADVEKDVATAEYFATTTDLWSSRKMEPYISLTLHFIDPDFNLKTKCLQTAFFPADHTGEHIAAGLRQAMASWDLEEGKLVCMTTDNASNMHLAAQLNGWVRLHCFGHRLHLAIGESSFLLIVWHYVIIYG